MHGEGVFVSYSHQQKKKIDAYQISVYRKIESICKYSCQKGEAILLFIFIIIINQ